MDNAKRLDEIRERCEAARPGTWYYRDKNYFSDAKTTHFAGSVLTDRQHSICPVFEDADGLFIAHAHEDIPFLLGEVERLQEDLERMSNEAAQNGKSLCAIVEQLFAILNRLKSENDALHLERDAAVADINEAKPCLACKRYMKNGGVCYGGKPGCRFEWLGLREKPREDETVGL